MRIDLDVPDAPCPESYSCFLLGRETLADIRLWIKKCWAAPSAKAKSAAGVKNDGRVRLSPRSAWLASLRFWSPRTCELFRSADEATERVAAHLPVLHLLRKGGSQSAEIVDSDGCPESPIEFDSDSKNRHEAVGEQKGRDTGGELSVSSTEATTRAVRGTERPRSAVTSSRPFYPIFGCPVISNIAARHKRPATAGHLGPSQTSKRSSKPEEISRFVGSIEGAQAASGLSVVSPVSPVSPSAGPCSPDDSESLHHGKSSGLKVLVQSKEKRRPVTARPTIPKMTTASRLLDHGPSSFQRFPFDIDSESNIR